MTSSSATALVPGGTGGLGVAVVARLLRDGWRVVVPSRSEDADRRLAGLADSEQLELIRADPLDEAAIGRAVQVAASRPDAPLSGLVNLVGGFAMGGRVHETSIEDFDAQLRLNVRPTFLASRAVLPHMIAAGGGSIVCVSSAAARAPFPGASGYVTSKAAVLGLVDVLAAEYRADGVRVNALLPTVIDTPANRISQPNADRTAWVAADMVARTAAFLVSEGSAPTTGAHMPVSAIGRRESPAR